jgi:hypothetical protein
MAVSQSTQAGFYGDHATEAHYVKTLEKAESMKQIMRSSGLFRKVSHTRINDGSRAHPRWEYKVMGWK